MHAETIDARDANRHPSDCCVISALHNLTIFTEHAVGRTVTLTCPVCHYHITQPLTDLISTGYDALSPLDPRD